MAVSPVRAALVAVLAGVLVACGSAAGSSEAAGPGDGSPGTGTGTGTGSESGSLRGTITVFAAASLKESFAAIGERFMAEHPSSTVTFSFGPSSGLATQITQGAPADVFAAASEATMLQVVDANRAAAPRIFARNALRIAVPPDNPGRISALADVARPGVKLALCQERVPCGAAARQVLQQAGLAVTPVTLEVDVKAVLTKVQLGEVDAGLVYVTDVLAAGEKVRGIEIRAGQNATTTYPIAAVTTSEQAALAQAFVDAVLSPEGQATLARAGFQAP